MWCRGTKDGQPGWSLDYEGSGGKHGGHRGWQGQS